MKPFIVTILTIIAIFYFCFLNHRKSSENEQKNVANASEISIEENASSKSLTTRARSTTTQFSQNSISRHDKIIKSIEDAKSFDDCVHIWKDIANSEYKGGFLSNLERTLLYKVVSLGGYNQAKDMIYTKYGSGTSRTSLIPVLFFDKISLDQCLERLKTLQFQDEKSAASAGYAASFSNKDGLQNFVSLDWIKAAEEDSYFATELLANGVSNILKNGNNHMELQSQSEGIESIVNKLDVANCLNKDNITRILDSINKNNTSIAWNVYNELSNTSRENIPEECRDSIIRSFVNYDPGNAMHALQENHSEADLFEPGFEALLRKDATMANRWLDDNRSQLDQIQMDHISMASLKHALNNGDAEIAKQWLQQIQDEVILKTASDLIK